MSSTINTPEEYINSLPEDRKIALSELRKILKKNPPKGFKEVITYGMIGFVVPQTLYPNGYHCDPKLPLPFLSIASQKNFIAIYHMGLYADADLLIWFTDEYAKHSKNKLDMGKAVYVLKK